MYNYVQLMYNYYIHLSLNLRG